MLNLSKPFLQINISPWSGVLTDQGIGFKNGRTYQQHQTLQAIEHARLEKVTRLVPSFKVKKDT